MKKCGPRILWKLSSPQRSLKDHCKTILHKLYIKIGPFTTKEIDIAITNIKNGKATGLDEIPSEVWKIKEFQDILLKSCNSVYSQDPIERWTEGCILHFPKKGNLTITDNYRGITLTPIAAKIYNLMILNRIRPYVDPIMRKNQNGFRTNRSTLGQILAIRRIIELRQQIFLQYCYLLTFKKHSTQLIEQR